MATGTHKGVMANHEPADLENQAASRPTGSNPHPAEGPGALLCVTQASNLPKKGDELFGEDSQSPERDFVVLNPEIKEAAPLFREVFNLSVGTLCLVSYPSYSAPAQPGATRGRRPSARQGQSRGARSEPTREGPRAAQVTGLPPATGMCPGCRGASRRDEGVPSRAPFRSCRFPGALLDAPGTRRYRFLTSPAYGLSGRPDCAEQAGLERVGSGADAGPRTGGQAGGSAGSPESWRARNWQAGGQVARDYPARPCPLERCKAESPAVIWGNSEAMLAGSSSHLLTVASFFGESFVELNIIEASPDLSLHLKFQTSKPNGLLFLAAGKDDYCTVELISGNLQVRVNLGTGELVLHSQQKSRLDDLAWHVVELHHASDSVTLVIDRFYRTSGTISGRIQGLNIQQGIYIGGSGNLDVPYLERGHSNFRGCMEEVIFNQHEILNSLRSYPGFKKVHEVSLGCSDEFFAGENEAVNFFSSKSYVAFPRWNIQGEGLWEFTFQTGADQGLLLYQSGRSRDFVALEIEAGFIKAHVGRNQTKTELPSLSLISDNEWHFVKLQFNERHFSLLVDEERVKISLPLYSRAFECKGPLFVGGVDNSARAEIKKLEFTSISRKSVRGGSFKGCLRGLKVNSKKLSLKNALVSKDIAAGCNTKSNDFSSLPMTTTEKMTLQTRTPSSSTPLESFKSSLQEDSSYFLNLNDLVVQEGGQAPVESKHIRMNSEFKDLDIHHSQVLFKIKEKTIHGDLRLDVAPESQVEATFTMLDLWQERILYVHDGSESTRDYFVFSVSISKEKEIPFHLQRNDQYVFNITITPVNDPPELFLPEGNLLLLLENSKKRLTSNMIEVLDPDTHPSDLTFSVLGNFNADTGYLENSKHPGKIINTFTNEDLQGGRIFYVHHGLQNSRIVLRVSDGELVSNTAVLRVKTIPWDYKVVNNTGVAVQQGNTVLITQSNLSVQLNAGGHEMEIRYDIIHPPLFGQIQRRSSSGEWKPVNTFSQRSVDRDRVRYCSTFKEPQLENVTDHFVFKISIENKVSEELVFPIAIQWLKYKLVKNGPLDINTMDKKSLTSDHLMVRMENMEVLESKLHFKLLSLPKKGKLLLGSRILKLNSTFSQKNIIDGEVAYELLEKSQETTQDSFRFLICTNHMESKIYIFRINIRADPNRIILINKGFSVTEGEGKLITKTELFAQTLDNQVFHYKISKNPQHGKLKLINFSDSLESNDHVTTFTNQDIVDERVMYVHDDSENGFDEFVVEASAQGPRNEEARVDLEIRVNVTVTLKNDEKPVRVVDKVFHVVRNGQRLLTLTDLCYHDPDSDFNDRQLLYTRRGIPNGDLVLAGDPSQKLYQFQQGDLEEGHVLFRHHGADHARFVLFVTDGTHYTSSLLEVSASEPYLRIANNTGLLVLKGREETLTTANLSVATNHDIRSDTEIKYEIFLLPKYGRILVKNRSSASFSQHDLKQGYVIYRHDGNNNLADIFNLTAKVKDIHLDVGIYVQVYLESHQHPPKVVHSKSLLVEEGKSVKLSRRELQAVHENNSPSEIMFIIRNPPVHGQIRKFVTEDDLGAIEDSPSSFTQQDVDDGHIHYEQTASDQQQDRFLLDVTNGVQAIRGIEILVDIIPRLIPLVVQNFTVLEGGSRALLEDFLKIPNHHFVGINCEFVLVEQPKHGYVENSHFPRINLMRFTRNQVEKGLIYYVHDGSEELLDRFTVFVNNTELGKQSLPQTVFVMVKPVNDEVPVIVANKILRVWVNSVTEITRNDLCAEDTDSSPGELSYSVTLPSNGHLALKSFPNRSILNFTQVHINEGHLVFVHTGAMSGGFSFQVTDGLNFAPRQIFSITAQALVLSLEANQGLGVFPGSTKPISSHVLKAVTNDGDSAGNRTITFTVLSSPKFGRLIRLDSGNDTQDVSAFTQHAVDEGLILYKHTNSELQGWDAEDSFTFMVSSPPTVLGPQVFPITISYDINEPGQPSHLLANTGAVVQEGRKVLIDRSKLDASNLLVKLPESQRAAYEVWYQVTSLPHHGTIVVGERNVTKEKPYFSQYIINKYGITYQHDDSESLADNFTFSVWLNQKSKSAEKPEVGFLEEVFNVTISPVNDQAPKLKTKGLSLKVLQGNRLRVGPDHLKVEDLDNPPEEIAYAVISRPSNGFLARTPRLDLPIHQFTQADIDNGHLWFVQDGSPTSGVFYFSVTDGKHSPLYKLFHLEVIPISVTLVNLTDLLLPQGQTSVSITSTHLSAMTNGQSTEMTYELLQPLQHGHLLMENERVTRFRQADLFSGRLSYHMTNLTAFQDKLQFAVLTAENNLTGQTLRIRVQPLLRASPAPIIPNRMAYRLGRKDLDATDLARLTKSVPTFEVTEPPAHGRLVRRASGRAEPEGIDLFTQMDIDQGVLMLDTRANMTGVETLNDSFTFTLKADHVQPAVGYFPYTIVPPDPFFGQSFTPEVPAPSNGPPTSTVSQERSSVSLGPAAQTDGQRKTTQARSLDSDLWGSQKKGHVVADAETSRTQFSWPKTTSEAGSRTAGAWPRESGNPLMVVVPLSVATFLLIVAVMSLCICLMCRKVKKAKPVVDPQASLEPRTPNPSPERSATIPSVTVTPLKRSSSSPAVSPYLHPRCQQLLAPVAKPVEKISLWNSWMNLDPEMVQHCRKTNPTLRRNQYWV
ncbi:chondroitin sulfate proteoglycan 4-like [Gracilinanus agilis]|uniref:chondroitin sulfate proteoglycan 4-like n=1 Tax=Gracilinanus agilis TaxID=191870 RepID=UPI001CFD8FA2|nr:chondroitin sulfate proteoglycan 4-like [Gracilinanus agilis]